ncbi:hypothetical protein [Streptomyces sp. NPDC050546]|uniref:hypothetical protein n=1 Tax=Streptomyces sp. NPDC050546 TaxID=3365628 RepID=UPI0037BBA1B9
MSAADAADVSLQDILRWMGCLTCLLFAGIARWDVVRSPDWPAMWFDYLCFTYLGVATQLRRAACRLVETLFSVPDVVPVCGRIELKGMDMTGLMEERKASSG